MNTDGAMLSETPHLILTPHHNARKYRMAAVLKVDAARWYQLQAIGTHRHRNSLRARVDLSYFDSC